MNSFEQPPSEEPAQETPEVEEDTSVEAGREEIPSPERVVDSAHEIAEEYESDMMSRIVTYARVEGAGRLTALAGAGWAAYEMSKPFLQKEMPDWGSLTAASGLMAIGGFSGLMASVKISELAGKIDALHEKLRGGSSVEEE